MTKKLFLSLIVCLGLVIGTNAWALDYTYTESGGEATITGYTGTAGDIVIPDTIEGFPVVSIGEEAFYGRNDLTSATIPDSVASIGRYAFRLTSLSTVYFLGNAPSTGEHIFGCTPGNHDAICRGGGGCGMLPLFALFKICYILDKLGYTSSMWEGYLAEICADSDGDGIIDSFDDDTIYGYISGDVPEGIDVEIYVWSCGIPNPVATLITDSEGYFSIGNLGNSRYLVIPADADFNFEPEFANIRMPQTEIQSYDFTATADQAPEPEYPEPEPEPEEEEEPEEEY